MLFGFCGALEELAAVVVPAGPAGTRQDVACALFSSARRLFIIFAEYF